MSPRRPAVLRDGSGQNLRDYLIMTAARLIDQRGSAGLAVRDITREAKVADGVLYNYFEDKEDLLAHALLAHVGNVMASAPQLLPPPGEGTLAENLRVFIEGGMASLLRVTPAFAGLLSQPKVLTRFHAMVGGDTAFSGESATPSGQRADGADGGGRSLGELLGDYLHAEQKLGRINGAADVDAITVLLVGAIHGQVLPRMLFNPPGTAMSMPPDLAERLARAIIAGMAPA